MKVRLTYMLVVAMLTAQMPGNCQDLATIGDEKPVKFSSGISLTTSFYSVSGRAARQEPFAWYLSGSPTLELYGMSFPFRFQLSSQHRSIQQPFNQFGMTPTYKWMTFHVGYSAMTFSKYTLSGHRFLGGGVELKPGIFRFSAMYGRLRKGIPLASNDNFESDFLNDLPLPSFSRKGYGAKIGIGSDNNFFDISFFKGWDNLESEGLRDATILPEENAVLGLTGQLKLGKAITWSVDLGISAYTRDQNADTLSTSDLKFRELLLDIISPRESSQLTIGGDSKLSYQGKSFGLSLDYTRIEPEYRTMGAYYFLGDIERYSVAPSFRFMRNRLTINGSVGIQKNNIRGTRINDARRFIGSAAINFNPNQDFGISANYVNYGISQRPVERRLSTDTIVIEQVNQNLMIAPRFNFGDRSRLHTISFNAFYQILSDQQSKSDDPTFRAIGLNSTYGLTLRDRDLNASATIVYRTTSNIVGSTSNLGLNTSVSKSFNDKKVSCSLNGGYFHNTYDGSNSGSTIRLGSNLRLRLWNGHSLGWNTSWVRNVADNTTLSITFNEFRSFISYNLNLQ